MPGSPTSPQSLLTAIIQSSDDAIVSKDLNSIVTSWNPAAERMFGYTAAEMIGRSIRTIIPEDRQYEEDEVLARIRAGEVVDHFETIRKRKDGSFINISLSLSPVRDADGTIVGASKIARDITERLRARAVEERNSRQTAFLSRLTSTFATSLEPREILTSLAELSVPYFADWCAVDVLTDKGVTERIAASHVDPAKVALVTGLRLHHEHPRTPMSPTHVGVRCNEPSIVLEVTDAALANAAGGDAEALRILRRLGLLSYLCLPLTVQGRTIGTVTLGRSESGRRFDEEDVRVAEDAASRAALAVDNARAYEELQAANQLKDEFLATLSHELRTPLNAILGYARMLRSGILKEDRKEQALETLERNASSLTQMVEDVLDVSRIAAGKIRLHIQPVDLAMVLGDALATIRPAADAKGVRLEPILEPHAGPVSGDPDRLRQVFWNLLSNAVKFTPRGGRAQLRLQRVNSHVEVTVSDTGIGIREDFLPYLFERFRQGDSTTTRTHGGLGLGLAIARRIVELHGGRVEAFSPGEGKGATFRVKLPIMIVHTEAETDRRVHPRGDTRRAPAEFPTLPDICVLAVDDDPDALGLVREILESAGARVRTATSAREALESIEQDAPDVLVSDLGMPGMDGYEMIKRVRNMEGAARELPAAALTAYARSEDRARALRLGFEMHLAKPIDPSELIAAVASLARRRRATASK
ncbi:MAG TPA: PAS domain S-box protein [Vicinamibacterales bacterium]